MPAADLAVLAAEVLASGGLFHFHADGSSMLPVIHPGAGITLAACRIETLRTGDIVMWRNQAGAVIVHRVIGRSRGKGAVLLRTMGDNLPAADAPFFGEEIVGRVVRVSFRGRPVTLEGPLCRTLSLLLALSGRTRVKLVGASGWRKWLRRALTASRLFLRRLLWLDLYLRSRRSSGGASAPYADGPGK